MIGRAAADRLVVGRLRRAARIARDHADHAVELHEHRFRAPEAAAAEDDRLRGAGGIFLDVDGGIGKLIGRHAAAAAKQVSEVYMLRSYGSGASARARARRRRESRARPRAVGLTREQPIVQPALAPLPEFDRLGRDAIAAPERRQRHRPAGVLGGQLGVALFERPRGRARPGSAPTPTRRSGSRTDASGSTAPILRAGLGHGAGDAHLPFELGPEQQQATRAGCRARSLALRALVVGEEDEAVRVEALEQHDARRRLARARCGGQRHRVDVEQLRVRALRRTTPRTAGSDRRAHRLRQAPASVSARLA